MSRWLAVLVVAFAVPAFAVPSISRADLIAPGARACDDRPLGATCDLPFGGSKGVCRQTTCSKLDYSQGTPPKPLDYPCVRCLAAPPKPAAPKDAGAAPSSAPSSAPSVAPSASASGEPSAAPEPSASQVPSAPAPAPTPSAAPTPAPTSAPAEPMKKQGACHAAPGAASALGGSALVGMGALAAALRRRRARR